MAQHIAMPGTTPPMLMRQRSPESLQGSEAMAGGPPPASALPASAGPGSPASDATAVAVANLQRTPTRAEQTRPEDTVVMQGSVKVTAAELAAHGYDTTSPALVALFGRNCATLAGTSATAVSGAPNASAAVQSPMPTDAPLLCRQVTPDAVANAAATMPRGAPMLCRQVTPDTLTTASAGRAFSPEVGTTAYQADDARLQVTPQRVRVGDESTRACAGDPMAISPTQTPHERDGGASSGRRVVVDATCGANTAVGMLRATPPRLARMRTPNDSECPVFDMALEGTVGGADSGSIADGATAAAIATSPLSAAACRGGAAPLVAPGTPTNALASFGSSGASPSPLGSRRRNSCGAGSFVGLGNGASASLEADAGGAGGGAIRRMLSTDTPPRARAPSSVRDLLDSDSDSDADHVDRDDEVRARASSLVAPAPPAEPARATVPLLLRQVTPSHEDGAAVASAEAEAGSPADAVRW